MKVFLSNFIAEKNHYEDIAVPFDFTDISGYHADYRIVRFTGVFFAFDIASEAVQLPEF